MVLVYNNTTHVVWFGHQSLAQRAVLLLFTSYSLKNFASCSMTNCGCSSGIQCPESGTVMPVTFAANACVEFSARFPGKSPPKAGYISPPNTNTGICNLVSDNSLFCSAFIGNAL